MAGGLGGEGGLGLGGEGLEPPEMTSVRGLEVIAPDAAENVNVPACEKNAWNVAKPETLVVNEAKDPSDDVIVPVTGPKDTPAEVCVLMVMGIVEPIEPVPLGELSTIKPRSGLAPTG